MGKAVNTLLLTAYCLLLGGVSRAEDTSAIVLGDSHVSVTAEDIDRYILENIPAEKRADVLRNPRIYREMAQNLYIIRHLAAEAQQKLGSFGREQAEWASRIAYQRRLVAEYRAEFTSKALEDVDWEAAAREVYLAEPERFTDPEQVSVSHILIKTDKRGEGEAREFASELRGRALSGEDFAALAEEYSEDPSVTENQGDMGYFPRGRMVGPFEEAAFALQRNGEVSTAVKTKFGYHVIRLNGRKAAKKKPFSEVKNEIIAELEKNLGDQLWQDKIIALRSSPDIQLDEEALKELAGKYIGKTATTD